MHDVAVFDFADDGELWILAFDSSCPPMPESVRDILPGVHADAVRASDANPPESILNQIARNLWIVLIEVGKEVEKPTFHRFFFQQRNGPRIVQRPRLKNVGQMLLLRAVEPGGRGRIIDPGMIWPDVIHDFILAS